MGYPSPYREVGVSALARPKLKRDPGPRKALFAGMTDRNAVRLKHKWKMSLQGYRKMRLVCQVCDRPKFAVYGQPCLRRRA